jgi:hypothetical protein
MQRLQHGQLRAFFHQLDGFWALHSLIFINFVSLIINLSYCNICNTSMLAKETHNTRRYNTRHMSKFVVSHASEICEGIFKMFIQFAIPQNQSVLRVMKLLLMSTLSIRNIGDKCLVGGNYYFGCFVYGQRFLTHTSC